MEESEVKMFEDALRAPSAAAARWQRMLETDGPVL